MHEVDQARDPLPTVDDVIHGASFFCRLTILRKVNPKFSGKCLKNSNVQLA